MWAQGIIGRQESHNESVDIIGGITTVTQGFNKLACWFFDRRRQLNLIRQAGRNSESIRDSARHHEYVPPNCWLRQRHLERSVVENTTKTS